jgi:class 3 adenylate cyclase
VTVVFSDLSGSTGLGERLDPESLSRVMAHYYEAMRAVVLRHGGTVEKFAGDAIMAVFGIPVAHEDDALRGVRTAAGMHAALAEQNERLEREAGCGWSCTPASTPARSSPATPTSAPR